jgi:hypothetical protein
MEVLAHETFGDSPKKAIAVCEWLEEFTVFQLVQNRLNWREFAYYSVGPRGYSNSKSISR